MIMAYFDREGFIVGVVHVISLCSDVLRLLFCFVWKNEAASWLVQEAQWSMQEIITLMESLLELLSGFIRRESKPHRCTAHQLQHNTGAKSQCKYRNCEESVKICEESVKILNQIQVSPSLDKTKALIPGTGHIGRQVPGPWLHRNGTHWWLKARTRDIQRHRDMVRISGDGVIECIL